MITTHIMISMLLILVAVLVPVIYFKKSKHISLVVFFLGGVGFYLSSQVLEKILHRIVLQPKADGSIALQMENPWLYVLYGVAVAAIFEETARWIVFYLLQKKRPMTVSDGLAYGLGHGGIEALFIGIVSLLNFWIIAQAVTQGNAQLVTKVPQATIDYIKSLSAGSIYLLVFERIVAVNLSSLTKLLGLEVSQRKGPDLFSSCSRTPCFD